MTAEPPADRDDVLVGALVTLELPADSPALDMPWIITFGPLSDEEEWEPVVCGPYERPHALALAESVVADDELMAVVEPLLPHVSVEEIRGEIAAAKLTAEAAEDEEFDEEDEFGEGVDEDAEHAEHAEPMIPPTVDQIRAGFARIASRLTGST
jgi:hypothetical protein